MRRRQQPIKDQTMKNEVENTETMCDEIHISVLLK